MSKIIFLQSTVSRMAKNKRFIIIIIIKIKKFFLLLAFLICIFDIDKSAFNRRFWQQKTIYFKMTKTVCTNTKWNRNHHKYPPKTQDKQ